MKWIKIVNNFDHSFDLVGNDGTRLYFSTTMDAPRKKSLFSVSLLWSVSFLLTCYDGETLMWWVLAVVVYDLTKPELGFRDLIPQDPTAVLSYWETFGKDKVAISYLQDVDSKLYIYDLTTGLQIKRIGQDLVGDCSDLNGKVGTDELFIVCTSFTNPSTIYRWAHLVGRVDQCISVVEWFLNTRLTAVRFFFWIDIYLMLQQDKNWPYSGRPWWRGLIQAILYQNKSSTTPKMEHVFLCSSLTTKTSNRTERLPLYSTAMYVQHLHFTSTTSSFSWLILVFDPSFIKPLITTGRIYGHYHTFLHWDLSDFRSSLRWSFGRTQHQRRWGIWWSVARSGNVCLDGLSAKWPLFVFDTYY